ncbi:MAG: DNA polymerase III subunit gamma/tau [Candidatus Bipolaricaulia bacterium]
MTSEARVRTHQSLYRRWRPSRFDDVVDQHYTVQTLRNAVSQGEIAHAYLFAGPRGTGKTSLARILAKAVNCETPSDGEPCNECDSCARIARGNALDIIEIDGASNRGIDQIRQLREEVTYAPTQNRYKVYIIDEVHMLTNEAFNALLKTLEEPPTHVIFLFATTEPHKVPPTVLSRCQSFECKNIPQSLIVERLQAIAQVEAISIEDGALQALARHARGALRNALVLLEQLVSYTGRRTITDDDLSEVLGVPPDETLDAFLDALNDGDAQTAIAMIADLAERGRDLELFLDELLHRSRDRLIETMEDGSSSDAWVSLTSELLEIKRAMNGAFDKRMLFEVKVLEWTSPAPEKPNPDVEATAPSTSQSSSSESESSTDPDTSHPSDVVDTADAAVQSSAGDDRERSQDEATDEASAAEPAPQPPPGAQEKSAETSSESPSPEPSSSLWEQLLARSKDEKIGIYALLTEGRPNEREGTLAIEFPPEYGFHKERLEQPANLEFVRKLVHEVYGDVTVKIDFAGAPGSGNGHPASTSPDSAPSEPSAPESDLDEKVELVRRIFDGHILD